MKYVVGFLFLAISGFGYASDSECVISPEKEAKMNETLYEIGVEWQFSFQGTLSELRKDAFNEGALTLVEKIDKKLLRNAILILSTLDDDKPSIKQKGVDAFSRFFEDMQYYQLTWSDSDWKIVKERMRILTKKSENP